MITDGPSYHCSKCQVSFVLNSALQRHLQEHSEGQTGYNCDKCCATYQHYHSLARHQKLKHPEGAVEVVYSCGICSTAYADIASVRLHREQEHRHRTEFEVVKTAHHGACSRARMLLPQNLTTVEEAQKYIYPGLVQYLESVLVDLSYFKVRMTIAVDMAKIENGVELDCDVFYFGGMGFAVSRDRPFHKDIGLDFAEVDNSVQEFLHRGSGWIVHGILYMDITIAKCNPLYGSCDLHETTYKRNVGLSVSDLHESDSGICFYKAVARGILGPGMSFLQLDTFARETIKWLPRERRYHVRVDDIDEFERLNSHLNIAVHVVAMDEKQNVIPVRCSRIRSEADKSRTDIPLMLCKYAYVQSDSRLLVLDKLEWHYSYIVNPQSTLGKRPAKHTTNLPAHICWNCATIKTTKEALANHISFCHENESRAVRLPKGGEVVSFANKRKSKRKVFNSAFLLVFDFESLQIRPEKQCSCPDSYFRLPLTAAEQERLDDHLLNNMMEDGADYAKWKAEFDAVEAEEEEEGGRRRKRPKLTWRKHKQPKFCQHKTRVLREQPAFCYAYLLLDREGKVLEKRSYTGLDAAEDFIAAVTLMAKEYLGDLSPGRTMEKLSQEERDLLLFENTDCWICDKYMDEGDRVLDHDHISGKVLGVAHHHCNLNRKEVPQLTCVSHNFTGYDSHFLVKAINSCSGVYSVSGIPQTTQKFKTLTVNGNIKFLDSLQFMNGSLSKLAETLASQDHAWPILKQMVPDESQRRLLDGKAPFPYSFCTSIQALYDRKTLPDKQFFDNDLTGEACSDEDYAKAQTIWNAFNCENMQKFCQVYVYSDVILLAEVFANFKEEIYKAFELDVCQYLSTPHISMDAMLKMTGVKLELLDDPEMIDLVSKSIRGGVSYAGLRYAKTRKRQRVGEGVRLTEVDTGAYHGDDGTCLAYFDKNNLYGEAMMRPLPVGKYRWLTDEELAEFSLDSVTGEDGGKGYILDVTLSYPKELHLKHNAFPLAPHTLQVEAEHLSEYQKECLQHLKTANIATAARATKLTGSFLTHTRYVVHGQNLKFYVEQGLILEEIHSAISFTQEAFVKPFIETCTRMRKEAKTRTAQEMYKL